MALRMKGFSFDIDIVRLNKKPWNVIQNNQRASRGKGQISRFFAQREVKIFKKRTDPLMTSSC